jgi:hypothetical protein
MKFHDDWDDAMHRERRRWQEMIELAEEDIARRLGPELASACVPVPNHIGCTVKVTLYRRYEVGGELLAGTLTTQGLSLDHAIDLVKQLTATGLWVSPKQAKVA